MSMILGAIVFLSRLCGGEGLVVAVVVPMEFLSRLCGGEEQNLVAC